MDIELSCSCGTVKGVVLDATPSNGLRVVCCCSDCQAFASYLQSQDQVLDTFGGTEVYQTSQSQVRIDQGQNLLRCVRLTSKGLRRWYTECCKTPVGNTMNSKIPFVGLVHSFVKVNGDRAKIIGPVRAYVQTQHARGTPDYPHSHQKFPLGITLKIMQKIAWWKLKGMHKPSAFFDDQGHAVSKPHILNT